MGCGTSKKLELWGKQGGGDLEPVLTSGAVALLDAQWIVSHAEAGGVLSHRQALPKEAFLSFADLVEATGEHDRAVAALSYPWLTKDHPDPIGANLSRVARTLKALLSSHPYGITLLLGEPKYLERQEASLRQQLDSARKMGALAGSLATRQAELRLELSEARPRYAAAVAKVKKLQADFEATLSELHFGGKRVNLMGAINAL